MLSHIFRRFALVLSLFSASVALGATLTVTSNSDAGAGSLRAALAGAGDGDTIVFVLPSGSETITLAAALPPIMHDLTIDGGTLGAVIIDGAGAYRVFFVDSGTVALSNLWIRNALAQGGAGGTGDGGGGGGAGLGAGLFVNQATAVVTVTNVNFISMSAAGGAGGSFVSHSYAGGGGGGMGFRGGMSTLNGGAPGGGGMLAPGADVTSGANGGAGGAGGGGGGGSYTSGTSGLGGSAYAGNDAGSAASTTNGGAGGFGGGGGGGPAGTGGAGGFGGGGGGTGISALGGVGGPGGGGGGSDGLQSTFAGGSLGSGVSGGQSGAGVGSGGGGGAAAGPAIFVRLGTLTTVNSAWYTASATGGAGGTGKNSHDGTAGTADSTPTFNYGGTVNGSTATGPIPSALLSAVPTLSTVSLASNAATASLAKSGDTVTLGFAASRPLTAPTVTLGGHSVTATNSSGNNWTASFTVSAADSEGAVVFSIAFTSTDGFAGTAVAATTDGSEVTIDSTAPTVPTGLAGNATSPTAIALSWATSTDTVGVAGYRIYRGGATIGTSATPGYTDTGLAAGTPYTYTVTSYDAAGDESAASAPATVRTQLAGAQSIAVRTTDELLAALATAAANPSATFTITVAAGTYTPTAGLTIGSDGLILEGSGTISGSALASGALLTISGDSIVVSGLTFADGIVSIVAGADHGVIDECDFVRSSVAGTGCTGWLLTGDSFRDTTAAALTFAGAADLVLADNVIVDCAQAFVLTDLAGPTVRNNFIADNRTTGTAASIVLTDVTGARIDHNTVYQAGTAANSIEYAGSAPVGFIRNNLANKPITANGSATATLVTNCTTAAANWFRAPAAGDLHLAASRTEVVGAATALADLAVDIDGDPRPTGSAADLGADEFQPDTVAPTAPTSLSASALSSSQVTLRWTGSTDSAPSGATATGVVGYRIYRNGTPVATSTTTSYTDTGLVAGTTFSYTVTAYDGAANESAASAAVSATTTTAPADTGTKSGGGGACGPLFAFALGLLCALRRRQKAAD
jgi:chitodextrinase